MSVVKAALFLSGGAAVPETNCSFAAASDTGEIQITEWDEATIGRPQPTVAELTTALADGTTVDHRDGLGPVTFSVWSEWHGGNAAKTQRLNSVNRLISDPELKVILRVIGSEIQGEVRGLKPGGTPMPQRTLGQLETDVIAAIMSGVGDDPA